jgi:hypothetical protein
MTDEYCESGVVIGFPFRHDVGEGCDVERLDQYAFYELAKTLQTLIVPDDQDIIPGQVIFPLLEARRRLGFLVVGDKFQLGISKTPCRELMNAMERLLGEHFEEVVDGQRRFKFPDKQAPAIPSWQWIEITTALQTFETVLREELREAATYYVPRRGIYFTPALVDAADETFPPEVRPQIPQKTFEDWRSAGRCLAFNLLSAAGFHVARAVEGTLESYYQAASGKPTATLKSWHDYAKELEKLKKPSGLPSHKIIAEILQMKDDYRNPIMHPRVVLTESDARMLFSNGESLIIGMAQELAAFNRDAPTLQLVPQASDHEEAAGSRGIGDGA